MNHEASSSFVLPAAVLTTGGVTILLASILAYTMWWQRSSSSSTKKKKKNVSTTMTSHDTTATTDAAIDRTKYPGGVITVYYGTQTGTAESFSQSLEREGGQYGFLVRVVDLEDAILKIKNDDPLPPPVAERSIFITATYGEGEAPDGALPFCQWLQQQAGNIPFLDVTQSATTSTSKTALPLSVSILSHVEYAVFGLGNTQYDHYNAPGKFMDRALTAAGAQRILPLGLGDDNTDLEADFETWKDQQLWPALVQRYHPSVAPNTSTSHSNSTTNQDGTSVRTNGTATTPKKPELPRCPYQVIYHNDATASPNYNVPMEEIHCSSRHYFTAYECPVTVIRELQTPTSVDSTVHVEIDIGSARALSSSSSSSSTLTSRQKSDAPVLSYTTADNLGVLPENQMEVVERVAEALGYQHQLDTLISVVSSPDGGDWHGLPFPVLITIRECFLRYLDLTSAPRRSDLKRLSVFCTEPIDQKALLRMSTKEGRQEYKEKILDRYVGFVDLLRLCPSIQMPLEHLLYFCAPLQTRFFTISSSSSVHPNTVHLTVAVTKHQRGDGSMFHGVCSTHLSNPENLTGQLPKSIRIFQRASSFRLPADVTKPIILIGPGTGIAPMRALLQEREYQRDTLNQSVGSNTLYFGCKHKTQDYLYREELDTWASPGGILTNLYLAFSRDQTKKVYVQDILQQNGASTWNLIRDENNDGGAYIYVCGGVQMGHDVTNVLKEIITVHGNMTTESAKGYLTKLSQSGRFVQELWA